MDVIEYKTPSLSLEVYEHYIVAQAHPLVKISEKELNILAVVAKKHFDGPFGLVEVRDKNISICPELHKKVISVLPYFSAYALVTNSVKTVKNLYKEKAFMGYDNFMLYATLDEAIAWVNQVVEEAG